MGHAMRKPVMPFAGNKEADQHAHPQSLISAFVVRCLESIMPSIQNFKTLASPWSRAGWFESPGCKLSKTGFLMTWPMYIWCFLRIIIIASDK